MREKPVTESGKGGGGLGRRLRKSAMGLEDEEGYDSSRHSSDSTTNGAIGCVGHWK